MIILLEPDDEGTFVSAGQLVNVWSQMPAHEIVREIVDEWLEPPIHFKAVIEPSCQQCRDIETEACEHMARAEARRIEQQLLEDPVDSIDIGPPE